MRCLADALPHGAAPFGDGGGETASPLASCFYRHHGIRFALERLTAKKLWQPCLAARDSCLPFCFLRFASLSS